MIPPAPLRSRVCVVTGSTSGIGLETARGLARWGATTVLVGRGRDRLEAAAGQIVRATPLGRVEWIETPDLAELSEMDRVAAALAERYPRIHVLVHNAGAIFFDRQETTDGIERTFALNVLAPFVLTVRLAPTLRASAPARVVNVASAAHRAQRLDLEDLGLRRSYSGYRAYARSKLALILLTTEFARRFEGTGVTVNSVHPGFVDSGWGHSTPGLRSGGTRVLQKLAGSSVEEGARTSLYVASSPAVEGVTGTYFARSQPVRPSRRARDASVAGQLFTGCARMARLPSSL